MGFLDVSFVMELCGTTAELKAQVEQLRSKKRNREDGAEIMTEAEIDALLVEIEKKLGQLELCAQRTKNSPGPTSLTSLVSVEKIAAEEDTEDPVLRLNIGGTEFTVSKSLIMSEDWMLSAMFSGRHALKPREDGAYYLERDPALFSYILNYLRDKDKVVLPSDAEEETMLMEEVDYYQLKGLAKLLRGDYARDFISGPSNVRIKQEENEIRNIFLNNPDSPQLTEPFLHLIDVFDPENLKSFAQEEGTPIPLMFPEKRKIDVGKPSSLEMFQEQFDAMTCMMFEGVNWDNIFIAGGSVLASLLPIPESYNPPPKSPEDEEVNHTMDLYGKADKVLKEKEENRDRTWCYYNGVRTGWFYFGENRGSTAPADSGFQNSDVDVFIYGLNEKQAKELYQTLRNNAKNKILLVRTGRTIAFIFEYPRRHIQLILRLYKTPAEVLLGFDIDCVCFGYDGKRVYCLPRARRAVNCKYNIADPSRQTFSYEYRLWKYSKRGFAVAVPGLVKKRISGEVFTKTYSELQGFSRLLFFEAKKPQEDADRLKKYYMKWYEDHAFQLFLKNYNGDDLSMTESELKLRTELIDYNEGIMLVFSPYHSLYDVSSNLDGRASKLAENGCQVPFLHGWDLKSVLVIPDELKASRSGLSDDLTFIGSLTEYLQSLPKVEDDWWKGVY